MNKLLEFTKDAEILVQILKDCKGELIKDTIGQRGQSCLWILGKP